MWPGKLFPEEYIWKRFWSRQLRLAPEQWRLGWLKMIRAYNWRARVSKCLDGPDVTSTDWSVTLSSFKFRKEPETYDIIVALDTISFDNSMSKSEKKSKDRTNVTGKYDLLIFLEWSWSITKSESALTLIHSWVIIIHPNAGINKNIEIGID